MAFTLVFGVLAFTLLYVVPRSTAGYRLAELEEGHEERELERAIAERARVADAGRRGRGGWRPVTDAGLRRRRVGASRPSCSAALLGVWSRCACARPRGACPATGGDDADGRPPPGRAAHASPRLGRASSRSSRSRARGRAARSNVVYFRTVSEAVAHRDERGRPTASGSPARSCPDSVDETRDGVRVRAHRRQATVAVVHTRRPARPVQGLRARSSCEGRWGAGDALRLRPHPDQARQRVRAAAEGRASARRRPRSREGVARRTLASPSGTAAPALGIATLALGLRRGDDRAAARRVAATCSSCSSPRSRAFGDDGVGAVHATTSRSSTSPRTTPAATPLLYTFTGAVGRARGLDPAVGPDPRRLPRGRRRARFRARATDPLVAWATLVGLVVALFFFALMLGPANPFRTLAGATPLDGAGPNPLLQNHPLMAFHPPMLYLGYVGFTIPFCVRDRRAGHRPVRRGLAGRRAPDDARRVGLPHGRHHPRRVVELRGARLGRLLGVGPGRERVAAAVAHRRPRSSTR